MKKINIGFKKVKAHSGEDKYNDLADLLAKKAVEILS
jgi:ribonuclease HI